MLCVASGQRGQRGLLLRLFDPFRPPFVTPHELSLRSLSELGHFLISGNTYTSALRVGQERKPERVKKR